MSSSLTSPTLPAVPDVRMTPDVELSPTAPIDMRTQLQDETEAGTAPSSPRDDPQQWRRHGLLPPAELAAIVAARLEELPTAGIPADTDHPDDPDQPTYGDFLGEPTA